MATRDEFIKQYETVFNNSATFSQFNNTLCEYLRESGMLTMPTGNALLEHTMSMARYSFLLSEKEVSDDDLQEADWATSETRDKMFQMVDEQIDGVHPNEHVVLDFDESVRFHILTPQPE